MHHQRLASLRAQGALRIVPRERQSHVSLGRGFSLDFVSAESQSLTLTKYGEYLYDHIILFAPRAAAFGALGADDIIDFVDEHGGNLIVAADYQVSEAIREIATECGVKLAPNGAVVTDHFAFESSSTTHTLIASDNFNADATAVFGKKASFNPVAFEGIAHDIDDVSNPLNFRLLSAHGTSFAGGVTEAKTVFVSGKDTTLVSALQARNNARVIFSGSLSLFSNKFFTTKLASGKSSGNRDFAAEISKWALEERSVLRASNIAHHLVGEKSAPAAYTIKDNIQYSVDIHEWNGEKWVPFKAADVQLEFVMLDPYVRLPMQHDGQGHFTLKFVAPDVYGIFTFRVDYQRLGYSNLNLRTIHPVRPFRHDQYERFIAAAYPYYAGAFSMLGGVVLFSLLFLYNKDPSQKSE